MTQGEKASSLETKRSVYGTHLAPAFGALPLDKITDEHVSTLRTKLVRLGRAPKTLNNVLSPLNAYMKLAIKWRMIPSLPCTIEIRPVSDMRPDFYDEPDYERLCDGAAKVGTREHVLVRLGGDAGLRRGEMMALRWCDVDFVRALLHIEQAAWKRTAKDVQRTGGAEWHIGKPKGGRGRVVPMTDALRAALLAHRHLRGEYVLWQGDGASRRGIYNVIGSKQPSDARDCR